MSEFENLVRKMRAYQIAGQISTIDRTKARILEKEVDKYLKEREQGVAEQWHEFGNFCMSLQGVHPGGHTQNQQRREQETLPIVYEDGRLRQG